MYKQALWCVTSSASNSLLSLFKNFFQKNHRVNRKGMQWIGQASCAPWHACNAGYASCSGQMTESKILNDPHTVHWNMHNTKTWRGTHTHTLRHTNKKKSLYPFPLNLMIHRSSDLGFGTLSAFDLDLRSPLQAPSHKTPFTTAVELRST